MSFNISGLFQVLQLLRWRRH